MPIKKKLLFSHGTIIVSTFILILVLLAAMKMIEGNLVKLFEGPTTNIWYSADLYYTQIDIQRAVNRVMAEGVENLDEFYPQLEETVNKNLELMDEAYLILKDNLFTKEDKARLEEIQTRLENDATPHRTEVMKLLKAGDFAAAHDYNNTYYKPVVDEIKLMVDELETSIYQTAEDYCDSSATTAIIAIVLGIVLLVVVTAIAVTIAGKVTAIITAPVREITEAATLMHEGDMSVSRMITYESEDELGMLAAAMRGTMDNLNQYVHEISETLVEVAKGDLTKIQETANHVDSGSDELAGAANELASGTSEQASAVEELTATISTGTGMAENTAEAAAEAYKNIMQSVEEAETERAQMRELQEEASLL